jgi:hypothetical protein
MLCSCLRLFKVAFSGGHWADWIIVAIETSKENLLGVQTIECLADSLVSQFGFFVNWVFVRIALLHFLDKRILVSNAFALHVSHFEVSMVHSAAQAFIVLKMLKSNLIDLNRIAGITHAFKVRSQRIF